MMIEELAEGFLCGALVKSWVRCFLCRLGGIQILEERRKCGWYAILPSASARISRRTWGKGVHASRHQFSRSKGSRGLINTLRIR